MLVLSVEAWATCCWASAAPGARAIRAPRPMATYLLIIAVPLRASLPTLVSRTISICAPYAELEMNVGFSCRSPRAGSNIVAPLRLSAGPNCECTLVDFAPAPQQIVNSVSSLSSTFLRVAVALPRGLPASPPCHSVFQIYCFELRRRPAVAAVDLRRARANRGGWRNCPGTTRSRLPPEPTADECDEQAHRPSERRVCAAHSRRRGRNRCGFIDQLQSGGGRLRRRKRRAGRRGRVAPGRKCAGSSHSRLDAAWRFGNRDLPALAGARGDPDIADHHGHRPARGIGARARSRGRRG